MNKPLEDGDFGINPPRSVIQAHPIETGIYFIDTQEISITSRKIVTWIEAKSTGGIIYGNPRLGKTHAIKYTMNILRDEYGSKINYYYIPWRSYQRANESTFFEDLLLATNHAFTSGRSNIKRDRLFKYLLTTGEYNDKKQIVFFIDDAQRLLNMHYEWLMDIYNELYQFGITLTVILIGQYELEHLRSSFNVGDKKQLIGRFMIKEHEFKGLTSISDIKYLLAGFDYAAEYPIGSGWSFTRYFFPEGFALGYRALEDSGDVFNIYQSH